MAVSFSRPDPASPAAVASASFGSARRGFDQDEVRDFLRMVSAELSRLQERERFLEREVAAAQTNRVDNLVLDEETVTRVLGEEASKVIGAAREAAASIRGKAEDGAARLLREAQEEAGTVREQAELEAARKRQDASHDAEAEMEQARQRGKDMVEEAREYREKVLVDLSRRRELARQQITQLTQGKERLVSAYERARLVAVDILAEVGDLGDSDDDVNLAPTTGPVPVVARYTPSATQRFEVTEITHTSAVVVSVEDDRVATVADIDSAVFEAASTELAVQSSDVALEAEGVSVDGADIDEGTVREEDLAPVVTLFAADVEAPVEGVDESTPLSETSIPPEVASSGSTDASSSIDDLFAKFRAARAETVARDVFDTQPLTIVDRAGEYIERPGDVSKTVTEDADAALDAGRDSGNDGEASRTHTKLEVVTEPDADPAVAQAAATAALAVTIGRSLKRVLADEQNDVLAVLRRKDPVRSLDVLVPWEGDHIDQYVVAIADEAVGAIDVATELIAARVVRPLRDALSAALSDLAGDNPRIANEARTLYRDVKNQVIDAQAQSIAERCAVASNG